MKKIIISCDKGCKKVFKIPKLKKRNITLLGNEVEEFYINCPYCKQEYHSYYIDKEMQDLLNKSKDKKYDATERINFKLTYQDKFRKLNNKR